MGDLAPRGRLYSAALLVAAWAEFGPWLADAELFSRLACRDRTVAAPSVYIVSMAQGAAISYICLYIVYFLYVVFFCGSTQSTVAECHPLAESRDGAAKRARTAASSASSCSSSQSAGAAAPKLTLHGGVPHHASLVALWHDERLTDFAVSAEGVEFKAHRVTLASSSKYFLNLFESGMRDAADATHALEGIRPKALWVASSTSSAGSASTGISARRRSMTLRRTAGRKSPNCSHFVAADL